MAQPVVRRYYATPIGYRVPILVEAAYESCDGSERLVYGSVRYLETEETSTFPGLIRARVETGLC